MTLPVIRRDGDNRSISFETLPLDSIKENAHNARRHSRKKLAALEGSINQFGFNAPVVVDENNVLLCGYARLAAARKLGLQAVPAVRASHLSAAQKRAFTLADNRLAQLASWDEESLRRELQFLTEFDIEFDLSVIGFETAEVNFILNGKDDVAPPTVPKRKWTKKPAVAKSGDVWRLGDHLLSCGPIQLNQADSIIRRWQADTGGTAIHEVSGERFCERERACGG